MSHETLIVDPSTARLAEISVKPLIMPDEKLDEELVRAVIAETKPKDGQGAQTVVQFERINPDRHLDQAVAYRPGMGWENGQTDISIHDVYITADATMPKGVGEIQEGKQGRWIPIKRVGEVVTEKVPIPVLFAA